jgi:hypothetical protein
LTGRDQEILSENVRRRFVIATGLVVVGVGAGLWLSSGTPARSGLPSTSRRASSAITLTCKDSVGQQGRGGERVVGGVEGLVLPGSGDPAALNPVLGPDGKRYLVYKAFLAVSSAVAPYATVSIISPASAKLFYGSSGRVGDLTGSAQGRALVAASRSQVHLPVCGQDFTGYVGGIIVIAPMWVTFAVSSPHGRTARVSVPIGVT